MIARPLRAALSLSLIAGVATRSARADTEEALTDFKAGRYLEASAEIQAVLDRSPGYPYGHFLLGHCQMKMGHPQDAEREFSRAVTLDRERAEYWLGWTLALNANGKWRFAVRAATEGLARSQDARTHYSLLSLRGYAYGALRRWSDAASDLDAAQRIHVEPWLLMYSGKMRFEMGDYVDAIPLLRQAEQSAPDDPVILRLLAESFLRLATAEPDPIRKRFTYTQALPYAQRLASVRPDDLDAVNLVGRATLGAGLYKQAENVFQHVLATDPRQCYAMANLGRTYMATSQWTEAEAYLKKASACAPRLTIVYESLGELYLAVGRPQDAAQAFRRAEELEPTREGRDPRGMIPVFAPR